MSCTGESFDSHTALLALWGFHLLAVIQMGIKQASLGIIAMLLRKAVFYTINLLISDMNKDPMHSVRPADCRKHLLNSRNNVACW